MRGAFKLPRSDPLRADLGPSPGARPPQGEAGFVFCRSPGNAFVDGRRAARPHQVSRNVSVTSESYGVLPIPRRNAAR